VTARHGRGHLAEEEESKDGARREEGGQEPDLQEIEHGEWNLPPAKSFLYRS